MANELIKIDMIDKFNSNGIRIERKKRKRRKSVVKRLLVFALMIMLCIGLYKAFPYIKELKLFQFDFFENSDTPQDENNNNLQNPTDDNINQDENTTNENDNVNDESNNQEKDESSQENTESGEEDLPEGHYAIACDKSEYTITNNSACDIDFSKECNYETVKEIYEIYGTGAPVVLITHFSSRECYSNGNSYTPQGVFYSNEKNIGNIGDTITSELTSLGVNTIHLNEIYASGAIYSSREEYEKSLSKTLLAYPSIAYVINISRDILVNDDMTMTKNTFSIDDVSYAQLSLSVGTNYSEITELQEKNILFANSLSKHLNSQYDYFVSSTEISMFDLSQNVTPVCFNLDIGSYANTFEEALASASLFAQCFSDMIK
ncbi:MAG: stage II sporulation protein P [Clostridia bacterium]|nr:stage II sporulation protein P [Clostridia bacterium]